MGFIKPSNGSGSGGDGLETISSNLILSLTASEVQNIINNGTEITLSSLDSVFDENKRYFVEFLGEKKISSIYKTIDTNRVFHWNILCNFGDCIVKLYYSNFTMKLGIVKKNDTVTITATDFKIYEEVITPFGDKYLPIDLILQRSISMGRIGNIGSYSLAMGFMSEASGIYAFSQGSKTQATGDYSHAEGYETTASGENSHTEGSLTIASGDYSHAEGAETTAISVCSHAEGYETTASGAYSHAEGFKTVSSGMSSSHAEGVKTQASGVASHAEGFKTVSSGEDSHAEGVLTTASGECSHAEGALTTASGECSHAEGDSSNSINTVISNFSSSTSNDDILTAWDTDRFSLAKGVSSHVEGKDNLTLGDYSHAEGGGNTVSGNYSHAEGEYTTASGEVSHAEGSNTTASGEVSHAEGYETTASGDYSHAEGALTTASGNYSHAEGRSTTASGECSHVEGDFTTASGIASHAEGLTTIASSDYQHVQGKYNIEDTENKYAHIVGNGEYSTKSNAHTLDWQGNAWYQGKLSQDGVPTEDKDLTTKKYVDDTKFSKNYEDLNNEPFTFVPIKLTETNESNGAITAYCDVFDLEQGYRYVADFTKYNYACLYTFNSDNTKNTLVATTAYLSTGRNGMITVMNSSATKRDILWMSAYGSEQIRVTKNSDGTFTITNTLIVPRVTNTREFTPTSNYHLVHKKYVDDAIASQPQISFDTEGNLVVTIGGVTKKFKEITE